MKQTSISISDKAAEHIADLLLHELPGTMLRVSVSGGGCSGFQYEFKFDKNQTHNDILIVYKDAKVLIDPLSLTHMKGSEIDFIDDLISQSLQINNPNATTSCGCGMSFSI